MRPWLVVTPTQRPSFLICQGKDQCQGPLSIGGLVHESQSHPKRTERAAIVKRLPLRCSVHLSDTPSRILRKCRWGDVWQTWISKNAAVSNLERLWRHLGVFELVVTICVDPRCKYHISDFVIGALFFAVWIEKTGIAPISAVVRIPCQAIGLVQRNCFR